MLVYWYRSGIGKVQVRGQEGCKEVPKTTVRHVRQAELNTRCHPNINKVLLAP